MYMYTKKHNTIFPAIFAILLFSCSTGNGGQAAVGTKDTAVVAATHYDDAIAKGEVIDSIKCADKPGQYYALYLPSSYTTARKFPCIYFFDAHARGALPLHKYKDLAERYGFILAGSDVSSNGMQWAAADE